MRGDVAKGIKSFKKGMTEEEEPAAPRRLTEEKTLDPVAPSRTVDVDERRES